MAGKSFNWGQYQTEPDAPSKFTWSQYQAEADSDAAPSDAQASPGAAQSALEHFGNAATFGYLPQIQAAAQPLFNKAMDLVTGNNVSGQDQSTYLQRRDENVARIAQEGKEHPYASTAGTVGGAIAGGVALSPLTPIEGATLAARAKQAAIIGAGYGAIANPGDTAGEYGGAQIGDRAFNSAIGAGTGLVFQPLAEGVGGAFNRAKSGLSEYAADKAAKALGMTKADYKRLGPDAARALGRAALDEGIVTPLSTPAKIEARTDAMKDVAGQKLGQVIDQAQSTLDQMAAVGMMPAGEPVQATSINYGQKVGKPQSQRFIPNPNSPGFNPYAGSIEVPTSTVEPVIERGQTQDFLTPVKPRPAGSIDAPALAQKLRGNGDIARLSKIPGMEGLASKIGGFLETLSKNPQDMTLRSAQELRQGIDGAINWGKRVPDMAGTQQYLVDIRNALSDAMNQSVDQAAAQSGGALGSLRQANQRYATLAKINDIAANRAAMNAANRAVGLTDTIAGGAGAGVGATAGGYMAGPMGAEAGAAAGAAAGGALNKFGRTFGPSLQATGANRAAQLAGLGAAVGRAASSAPLIPQAMIQSGIRRDQSAPGNTGTPSTPPALADSGANRTPAKGPDAWAQKGLGNLGIQDQDIAQRILQDPKGKQLLIQASDLKPGSKALSKIMDQIKTKWGAKQ